jgi:hypothetical protein
MAQVTASSTPNPNARKFTLDRPVGGMVNVTDAAQAGDHPLSAALFALDGVVGVFATADFVTVSKAPEADWAQLEPAAADVVAAHFS